MREKRRVRWEESDEDDQCEFIDAEAMEESSNNGNPAEEVKEVDNEELDKNERWIRTQANLDEGKFYICINRQMLKMQMESWKAYYDREFPVGR